MINNSKILPIHLISIMAKVCPKDAIFIDEGQTFSWFFKQYFPFTLKNTAYGTQASHMGWGLPFAAGAGFFHKDKKIICIVSDSGFLMGLQTLPTIAKYQLPILILVINNKGYASLKLEFNIYINGKNYNLNELNLNNIGLNYSKIALGTGIKSFGVARPNNLRETLIKALAQPGPVLIDIQFGENLKIWKAGWSLLPPK